MGVIRNVSLAGLDVLDTSTGGANVVFRDHGVFPNDEAFTFRFGSTDFSSMWVGKNGIVSFGGPVGGTATLDALKAMHGAIAAGWSDEWDTSECEVFAGYAPVTKSFATGERVLAFAVEWHNLRAPGWEPDRACSMRLLLFSDGTYRTDFGAMEASELGGMRLVTGYAGPGLADSSLDVDASEHTFGDAPAGTGAERVGGEAFGPAEQSDVGHLWVRWLGYPERSDAAGPAPVAVAAQLKQRKKLVFAAAGSNISPGARAVVDGTDAFPLKRSPDGKKWVVAQKAESVPAGRTVRQLWSDGAAHSVTVVNPDGQTSAAVSVP